MIRTYLRAAVIGLAALVLYAEIRDADERNDDQARAAELAVR